MIKKIAAYIEKLWTASIRRQLILGIVAVHAVLMTIFVFDLVHRQQTFLHDQGVAQTQSLAESLAANSTSWVLANDVLGLEEVVLSQTKYPGLKFAMIISPLGRVLAHNDLSVVGKYLQDENSKTLIDAGHNIRILQQSKDIIDIAAPVIANGQHIGWARVGISRDDVTQNLQIATRDGFLYTSGAIAVGVLFAVFMARGMTRSLKHMVEVANELQQDGKNSRIEVNRADELGTLGTAFNALADVVDKREDELRHHRDHLEELVDERTRYMLKEMGERKSAEEKVKMILNSAVDGIITADPHGTITSFNRAAEQIFGYSVIEVTGKNLSILMPEQHSSVHDNIMAEYLKTGEKKVIGVGGREFQAKRKDGSIFPMELAISELKNETTHLFTGIVRDITERKEAEQKIQDTMEALQTTQAELVQAEKMASLGGLVAGIAHEINTPIGVGVTATSHLKEQAFNLEKTFNDGTMRKSDFKSFIETATQSTTIISANLDRASDLIKSFKQVAVDQSSQEARSFNLLGYIDEVLFSLRPRIKQTKQKIEVSGDRDLIVESFPGPISQIVTNLIMNSLIHAYDADDEGCIRIHATGNGELVHLTYSDDGKGMDEETVNKIFDPFFTTKRGSGGSGLGMHILFNQITLTLGGTVKCQSTPGEGTTFELTFPALKEA